MKIAYLSLSGNIKSFVDKVTDSTADTIEISYLAPCSKVEEDYILIIPSYSDEITNAVCEFIDFEDNRNHLLGVFGSGNRNFDDDFCFSAKEISKKYNIPLIFNFEFSGTEQDVERFKKEVSAIEISRVKQEG